MTYEIGVRVVCYIFLGVVSALTWYEEDCNAWEPGLYIAVVILWPVVYTLEALAWCKNKGWWSS